METATVYYNAECSKSVALQALLDEKGIAYRLRYYMDEPLNVDELKALLNKLHLSPEDVVRTSEPVYEELYVGKILSPAEWLEALMSHPELLQRPIVELEDHAIIARPPEQVLKLFPLP